MKRTRPTRTSIDERGRVIKSSPPSNGRDPMAHRPVSAAYHGRDVRSSKLPWPRRVSGYRFLPRRLSTPVEGNRRSSATQVCRAAYPFRKDRDDHRQETDLESPIEKVVRIFSQPLIPDDWRQALNEIMEETVHRLRSFCMKASCTATISRTMGATGYRANSGRRPKPMAVWSPVSIGRSAGQAGYRSNGQTIRCSYCNRNWTLC